MLPDFSSDFPDIADGTETVQLHQAGSSSLAVAGALRRTLTQGVATRNPSVQLQRAIWHLPASAIANEVMIGDRIEAAGQQWRVTEATLATFNTRWRCVAEQFALIPELIEPVDIQQAAWRRGRGGEQLADWSTLHAAVPAVIRAAEAARQVVADQQRFTITHDITLSESLPVDTTHRVVDGDGRTYRIVAYRPDVLPVLQCAIDQP